MKHAYFVKDDLSKGYFEVEFEYNGIWGDSFDTFKDFSITVSSYVMFIYYNEQLIDITDNQEDLNRIFLELMKYKINNEDIINSKNSTVSSEDILWMEPDEFNQGYWYNKINGRIIK